MKPKFPWEFSSFCGFTSCLSLFFLGWTSFSRFTVSQSGWPLGITVRRGVRLGCLTQGPIVWTETKTLLLAQWKTFKGLNWGSDVIVLATLWKMDGRLGQQWEERNQIINRWNIWVGGERCPHRQRAWRHSHEQTEGVFWEQRMHLLWVWIWAG